MKLRIPTYPARRLGAVGFAFLVQAAPAPAQYTVDSWTTANGLPQSSVAEVLQTADGYLWFPTLDGLVRFDGVQLTVFNKADTAGIRSNRFNSILEDRQGALWLGTDDGGLTRYAGGRFTTFTTEDGLPHNRIFALRTEPDGSLLVATIAGLARWRDGAVRPHEPGPGEPPKMFGYRGPSGALWYLEGAGVHRTENGKTLTYALPAGVTASDVDSVAVTVYRGLFQDRAGALWIPTKAGVLYRFHEGRFTVYSARDGLPADRVTAISEDRQGVLWLSTGAGLVRFEDGRFTTYTVEDGLSSNSISTVFQDAEGTHWVGTRDNGVNRLSPQVVEVLTPRDGLSLGNSYPVLADRAGNVWIGTWGGGLNRYRAGRVTRFRRPQGLLNDLVTALAEDREGRIWVGRVGGVARVEGERIVDLSAALKLADTNVRAIVQARNGDFWFGTQSRGIVRYDGRTVTDYTVKDGLAGDHITGILEDRRGALWIATDGGLTRLLDGRFTSWTERDGLGSNRIRSLYEDAEGVLWIGTYDGGLSRLDRGRLTTYTTRQGLFNDGVFQILEDDHGSFWMSCNRGIYRVSRRELEEYAAGRISRITSTSYGVRDGLLNPECNGGSQPAGTRTPDGRLWFPTLAGVAVVDPGKIPVNRVPPPVVIQECLLDRRPADCGRPVEIGPGRGDLEIRYAGLSFSKPEQVTFKHRLEGLDSGWVEAGGRRLAHYSYLPPGRYLFRVIAANSDGVWNDRGASVGIVVRPAVWQTVWFRVVVVACVCGGFLAWYERRLYRLRRSRAAQEQFSRRLIQSQEEERKRIAAELHDGLGQTLALIRNRATLGLNAAGDAPVARSQLEEISDQSRQALDEVREIAYGLRPHLLDRLGLTRAIRSMIDRVAASSEVRFTTEIDDLDSLLAPGQQIHLYRILQESVNNVVKHAAAREARVSIKRNGGGLELTVEDDGRGFAPGVLPGDQASGLVGMRERARILGGDVTIRSAPAAGTKVRLRIGLDHGGNGDGTE